MYITENSKLSHAACVAKIKIEVTTWYVYTYTMVRLRSRKHDKVWLSWLFHTTALWVTILDRLIHSQTN